LKRRIIAYLSLLFLGVLVLAPAALLGTTPGARWLFAALEANLPLEVGGIEGALLRGLFFDSLAYRDGDVEVTARRVAISVDARCIVRSRVCVTRLEAEGVAVNAAMSDAPAKDRVAPLAFLTLLPEIEIDDLTLNHLDLAIGDWSRTIQNTELRGALGPGGVRIAHLGACDDLGCAELAGELGAQGSWQADASLHFAPGALAAFVPAEEVALPEHYDLDLEGTLTEVHGRITSPGDAAFAVEVDGRVHDALVADLRLDDLAALVPAVKGNPWLTPEGPLAINLRAHDENVDVSLRQEISGYGPRNLPLTVSLRSTGSGLTLTDGRLGEAKEAKLVLRGPLGTPGDLRPELTFVLDDLELPAATGVDIRSIFAAGRLNLDLGDNGVSWSLALQDLALVEGEREWSASANLAAPESGFFPVGTARVGVRDPGLTGAAAVPITYRRDDAGAPAYLDLPAGLRTEDLALENVALRVMPGDHLLAIQARVEGDVATTLDVRMRATESGAEGTLAPFDLERGASHLSSAGAIAFAWRREDRAIDLGPFCLATRGSRVCSDGAVLASNGRIDLALSLDERFEDRLGDKRFSVEARGPGRIRGAWEDWSLHEVDFDVSLAHLALDPFLGAATAPPIVWESAEFSGLYTGSEGRLEADLGSATAGDLELAVDLRGEGIGGEVHARSLRLAAFSDLVPEIRLLAGEVDADIEIGGSIRALEPRGVVSVRDAALRLARIDGELEAFNLSARIDPERVRVSGEGRLGGGDLGFEAFCCDGERLRGTLIGSRNRLRLPVGLDAVISPSLEVELAPSRLQVTGSLAVHEGVFVHSALDEDGVAVSRDVERIDTPDSQARRFDLELDLRTLIEPGFALRSRQLEASLSGDLRLSMRPRTPASLYGNLEVLGGELRAYGQALRLTEGSLGFVGNPLNPDLGISAEREIRADKQRVGFRVRGTLEQPLFELYSEPQLSNDATLSYLLRGRGPDVGVSADGTAMALSLGASAVNQSGVLSSLNAIPGLSGVRLGAEGSDEDMAATISAYVGNRLYLSYGVGIYEPVNALTARLFLRSRLWLEVVSRLENSFDLYYRFDWN